MRLAPPPDDLHIIATLFMSYCTAAAVLLNPTQQARAVCVHDTCEKKSETRQQKKCDATTLPQ